MCGYEKGIGCHTSTLIGYVQLVKCVCLLPKNLDFIRVCGTVVMNTRTNYGQRKCYLALKASVFNVLTALGWENPRAVNFYYLQTVFPNRQVLNSRTVCFSQSPPYRTTKYSHKFSMPFLGLWPKGTAFFISLHPAPFSAGPGGCSAW